MLPRHRAARLTWCRCYLRFRIQDWANILFTDESRFHLDSSDGRSRVYRRVGERYADTCVIQRQSFGGGSVMVWGGITAHGRTQLVVVAGNLTGMRYRDEIVQPYVIPLIQAQANNVTFQQDNARPHVARVVRDYLTQQNVEFHIFCFLLLFFYIDHIYLSFIQLNVIRLFRIMSIPTIFHLFRVLTSELIGRRLPVFTLLL